MKVNDLYKDIRHYQSKDGMKNAIMADTIKKYENGFLLLPEAMRVLANIMQADWENDTRKQ